MITLVPSLSLEEARQVLQKAHENYRMNSSVHRWQQFNQALRQYIHLLEVEERRRWRKPDGKGGIKDKG